MEAYEELSRQIKEGELRLINVVGVPRSVSTALGRSLNESSVSSVFVNEPFNRNNRSLDVAAAHILRVSRVITELSSDEHIPTVVTKSMSTYIDPDSHKALAEISDSVIWSVRDPMIQIGSLVTRIANDIKFETGADKVSLDDVHSHLAEVADFLVDSDLSQNFSRTGWASIREHYNSGIKLNRSIVVDGTNLVSDPFDALSHITNVIGIPFSARMVDGWQNDYENINTGSSRLGTKENAWTKHAANASGFGRTNHSPMIDISVLPDRLQEHMLEVAMPTYKEMTMAASLPSKY